MITLNEVRHAVRALRRAPAITGSAILCLALGLGATTAVWSAVNGALLRPLPFREPDRLVGVHRITPQSGPLGWSQSPANYLDFAQRSTQIPQLVAATWKSAVINRPNDAIQVTGYAVTGNFFTTLGASPELGRYIAPDDDRLDAPMVAVLSDELWRSDFGGDPRVVGSTVSINGQPTTIVGVAPRLFRVPVGQHTLAGDLWMPMRWTPQERAVRNSNFIQTFGRLAPGATVESAQSELRTIFADLVREHEHLKGDNVNVGPLHAESVSSLRTPLILLFSAVCMVLLIAATNVAALLLARGVQRRRELAVRAALGADARDALRLVLLESALLSAAGVVIGIGLAVAGIRTIGALAASQIPQLAGLQLDPAVLVFAVALSVIVALVCGAAPAWRSARVDPQDALRGGRGGGAGREQHRALRTLVGAEIALSIVLVIGAGLVLRGFAGLLEKDPGFDASRILTMRVNVATQRYGDSAMVRRFLEPMLSAVAGVPGVEAASDISCVPYLCWGNNSGIRYEGMPAGDYNHYPIVEQRAVSPTFFAVTKQRLVAGRLLDWTDDEKAPYVVVVNEAAVKRDFNGQNPVGKRFYAGMSDTSYGTIVGVVSDVRNSGPIRDPVPEMYSAMRQNGPWTYGFSLMIRVRQQRPMAVVSAVRAAVRGVDPTAAVSDARAMDDVIQRSLGQPRFYFILLGTFAAVAMFLAVAGLYGLLSYTVAQRTREMGIRVALGSTTSGIVRLVGFEGLRLALIGVVFGLGASLAVTRLMTFMLYGVSPLDVWAWASAVGVMLVAAVVAGIVPAMRAARVDPVVTMQTE